MDYEQVAGMSQWEQHHHLAYLRLHPPLEQMANLIGAQVCQTIAHYSPMRKGQTPGLDSFVLRFTKKVKLRGASLKAAWMSWAKKHQKEKPTVGHEDSQPQQSPDAQHE